MRRVRLPIATLFFFNVCLVAGPPALDTEYTEAIEEHRASREERLRSKNGWLTLAGLFWLEPGENRFGSDPDNPIVLDAPGIPPWAGTLDYDGERVRLQGAPACRSPSTVIRSRRACCATIPRRTPTFWN